ncbi:MAG: RsmB/NOP family class I SAM-dependent RNA methyltransferase [Pseudomonadota bacterium]
MRPAAQVQATIDLLDEIAASGYPADRVMAQYFRSNRYIGSKDKAAISEYFYTVLRNKLGYTYLLDQVGVSWGNRQLMAVLLKEQGQDLAALFNGQQYSPKPLAINDLAKLEALDLTALQDAPLHVQLGVPDWLAAGLEDSLGEAYEREMRASNRRASTDIRVNTLKADVPSALSELEKLGYSLKTGQLSPWCLRFDGRVGLFGLKSFNQGWFEVQDQGSQVLALISRVKAGDRVVDFCAGAGGKTLAMAAMMENKGSIDACDVHGKRLQQLSKRAKRAGAHNIRVHTLTSERDKWVKQHKEKADLVLIDAPCSGTGTWRRSPDSRWNLQPENLENLQQLQQSIMQSASRLVRPGGRLLYATCSLLKSENEAQIEQFLQDTEEFELGEIVLPAELAEQRDRIEFKTHQLRLFPFLSETDGFYVCELRRKG